MSAIALEAKEIVLNAAGDAAGKTIAEQMNHAAEALGYKRGHWRVHSAWYEQAGSWSAAAFEDLRSRYRKWEADNGRRADAADQKHAALVKAGVGGQRIEESRQARVERIRAQVSGMVGSSSRDAADEG